MASNDKIIIHVDSIRMKSKSFLGTPRYLVPNRSAGRNKRAGGKILKKRAGQNRRAGGKISGKSFVQGEINVQVGIFFPKG